MGARITLALAAAAIALSACTTYGESRYAPEGPPAIAAIEDEEPGYAPDAPPPAEEAGDEDRYGDYSYQGDEYERLGGHGDFRGPGAEVLDPWLAETREGWFIVTRGFRDGAEGYVSDEVAVRANTWFRRFADANRDMRLTDEEIRRALAWAVTGPNIEQAR
jgi:hypothetical protein